MDLAADVPGLPSIVSFDVDAWLHEHLTAEIQGNRAARWKPDAKHKVLWSQQERHNTFQASARLEEPILQPALLHGQEVFTFSVRCLGCDGKSE